jgi:hypothetical protein
MGHWPGMAAILLIAVSVVAWGAEGERPMSREASQSPVEPGVEVSGPEAQADGTLHYRVRSPYQRGETLIRLLLPQKMEAAEKRRVLFVLPVEPGTGSKYGDGLQTVKALNVHNRFGFVVVAPTFSDLPWYADHPTNPALRQESYMLKAVVPLIERLYPHEPRHRALLGFSKSGCGAYSLLLRNPDAFGAACAWDAPLMQEQPAFGMDPIVGTRENFERYRIPPLLEQRAELLRKAKRLGLFGYDNFRAQTQQAHALMEKLGIPHDYADGPDRKHHWDSGWLEEAAKSLRDMLP